MVKVGIYVLREGFCFYHNEIKDLIMQQNSNVNVYFIKYNNNKNHFTTLGLCIKHVFCRHAWQWETIQKCLFLKCKNYYVWERSVISSMIKSTDPTFKIECQKNTFHNKKNISANFGRGVFCLFAYFINF